MPDNYLQKTTLSEYSKDEFALLLDEIISANGGDEYQEKLIKHFSKIVSHPSGTDLIFWAPDDEANPAAIIKKIEEHCRENELASFKVSI